MSALPQSAEAAEVATCQLCGSRERTTKFQDGPVRVVTCSSCGLVYVTPRLQGQALLDVYDAGYWKSSNPKQRGYADYAREASLYLKTYQKRWALVQRWLPAHPPDRPRPPPRNDPLRPRSKTMPTNPIPSQMNDGLRPCL